MCDEIIYVTDIVSTNVANTVQTNMTSTIPTNVARTMPANSDEHYQHVKKVIVLFTLFH